MNKLPVLALFSLLFVASVSSFPLSESTLEDLASESDYHHHNEHFVDTTEDLASDSDYHHHHHHNKLFLRCFCSE